MQRWGVDYWLSIRTLMTISEMHSLESRSIDFVLAYPQADLDTEVCELPAGFDLDGNPSHYVLKLKKNLYGLKHAGFNWFDRRSGGIENRGFVPSMVDPCVFYRKDAIIVACRYMIVL